MLASEIVADEYKVDSYDMLLFVPAGQLDLDDTCTLAQQFDVKTNNWQRVPLRHSALVPL